MINELGNEVLKPLMSVLSGHKDDLSVYLGPLMKALKSAADSLQSEEATEADKFISQYFTAGSDWLTKWKDKFTDLSTDEVIHFIEEEGRKNPAILFGISYIGGLVLGRLGRHAGKAMTANGNVH